MRRLALVSLFGLLAVGPATSAFAADVPVTVTVLGTRALGAITLSPVASGSPSVLTVPVVETAAAGDASWSVTARLCAPHATVANTADCIAGTSLTSGANSIPASAAAISNRAVQVTGGGGTSTAPAGAEDLSAARTIFANTGQDTTAVYSGTYTSTSNFTLTVPANTPAGTYRGYVVVDLVQ